MPLQLKSEEEPPPDEGSPSEEGGEAGEDESEAEEDAQEATEEADQEGEDLVELYLKFSVPFANFICFLLGAPLALRSGRGGIAFGIIVALFLGFSLWAFLAICRAYGQIDVLPPILAAWLPNILFGGIGVFLFARART
ncbi:unnamed protein product [marine sediment metagenome]|uniref:LptF/LptG family permease n=1 Tax=marine sediment metagenome TaxID=412755 RepID=X1FDT9_9ZZZZ